MKILNYSCGREDKPSNEIEIYIEDTETNQKLEFVIVTDFPIIEDDYDTINEEIERELKERNINGCVWCPIGGDISNDCEGCVYADEYHLKNNQCVERIKHNVKTKKEFFELAIAGKKNWSLRINDRVPAYTTGDILVKEEINEQGNYTGRKAEFLIEYVFDCSKIGSSDNYVVLSIHLL